MFGHVRVTQGGFMAKSKMTVAEMIGLFLTPDAPVQVTAFDGSVFGQD